MQRFYRRVLLALTGALASAGQLSAQTDSERGLHGHVGEQSSYDDNLFRLPNQLNSGQMGQLAGASRHDWLSASTVGLTGDWSWGLQAITANVELEYNRFARNSVLNNMAGDARLEWAWRVSDRWSGKFGGNFGRALASFANNYYYGKDSLDTATYFGEFAWQLGAHWFARGAASRTTVTHGAAVRNVDDYGSNSGKVGIEYADLLGDVLGWEYRYANGRYGHDLLIDGLPFDRSYHDNITAFHVTLPLTGKTTLRGSTGYLKRTYPNSSIGKFSGSIWNASLEWQPGPKSKLLISGSRDLRAYVDSQSDYFVATAFSIAPTWQPTEKLAIALTYVHERDNYIGSNPGFLTATDRRDASDAAELSATWTPRQLVAVALSYQLARRESNIAAVGFDAHVAAIKLAVAL